VTIRKRQAMGSGVVTVALEQETVMAVLLLVCRQAVRKLLIVQSRTIPPLAVWVETVEMEAPTAVEMRAVEVAEGVRLVTALAAESIVMAKAVQS
jgi:hypothetical protein